MHFFVLCPDYCSFKLKVLLLFADMPGSLKDTADKMKRKNASKCVYIKCNNSYDTEETKKKNTHTKETEREIAY